MSVQATQQTSGMSIEEMMAMQAAQRKEKFGYVKEGANLVANYGKVSDGLSEGMEDAKKAYGKVKDVGTQISEKIKAARSAEVMAEATQSATSTVDALGAVSEIGSAIV